MSNKSNIIQFWSNAFWGININKLSQEERHYVVCCEKYRYPHHRKYGSKFIDYALKLLQLKPNNANYHFLIAQCYRQCLGAFHFDADKVDPRNQYDEKDKASFPNKYYEEKILYHFNKALEIDRYHPVFNYHFTSFLETNSFGNKHIQQSIQILTDLEKYLNDNNYHIKYKNDPYILDWHQFQCDFQKKYMTILRSKMNMNKLKHFYSKYIQLMNENKYGYSALMLSCKYTVLFSWYGEYKKAYQAIKIQYISDDYSCKMLLYKYQHIITLLIVEKYEECKQYILNIIDNYDKFKNLFLYHYQYSMHQNVMRLYGYLCIATAESMERHLFICNVNKLSIKCQRMIEKYDRKWSCKIDSRFDETLLILKCSLAYLLITDSYNKWKAEIDTLLDPLVNIAKLIEEYKKQEFEDFEPMRNGIQSLENMIPLSFFCLSIYLLAKISYSHKNKIKYMENDSTYYFILCLKSASKPITGSVLRNDVMPSYIPLSYYYLGINSLKGKQYQIAAKLLKKSKQITMDIPTINKNCKYYIKKCKILREKQKCNYCAKEKYNEEKLKSCKGCGIVFYCTKHCQKKDWIIKHKSQCSKCCLQRIEILKTCNF